MKSILENLNRSVGVIGSAVMTSDGMLVESAISDGRDKEALAAIGSSLVQSAQRSLRNFGGAEAKSVTTECSRGTIVLVNAGNVFLLVITDSTMSLDSILIDIKAAVAKLLKTISLDA